MVALSVGVVPLGPHRWPAADVPAHYLAADTLEHGFRAATASWAGHVREAGGECVQVEIVSGHDTACGRGSSPDAMTWAAI